MMTALLGSFRIGSFAVRQEGTNVLDPNLRGLLGNGLLTAAKKAAPSSGSAAHLRLLNLLGVGKIFSVMAFDVGRKLL